MGVYKLGQLKKLGQTHPKNTRKWVGSGNWMCMIFKIKKSIKINKFRVKQDSKNPLTQ